MRSAIVAAMALSRGSRNGTSTGKGVYFSLISFLTAIAWIFATERSTVQAASLWTRARRLVVSLQKCKDAAAGAIIHVVGDGASADKIVDQATGISSPEPALVLRRSVEQYQWKEETRGRKHKVQIHTYNKVWSRTLISSSKFTDRDTHINPGRMPLRPWVVSSPSAMVGEFKLNLRLLTQLLPNSFEPLDIDTTDVKLAADLGLRVLAKGPDGMIYMRVTDEAAAKEQKRVGEEEASKKGFRMPQPLTRAVYMSGNTLSEEFEDEDERISHFQPWKRPLVGDVRVRWEVARPQPVSVLAIHSGGGELAPWGDTAANHAE